MDRFGVGLGSASSLDGGVPMDAREVFLADFGDDDERPLLGAVVELMTLDARRRSLGVWRGWCGREGNVGESGVWHSGGAWYVAVKGIKGMAEGVVVGGMMSLDSVSALLSDETCCAGLSWSGTDTEVGSAIGSSSWRLRICLTSRHQVSWWWRW